ncbi:MAG: hypothetical protein JWM99_2006, partial [Verrucomicrobiales bacterium]|nr:hypothetical protein [Verrucomicrobiales bacterium]
MKKEIIRSILKQVQDGSIPREAGVRLCYEIRDLEEAESALPASEEVAIIGVAGRYPQAGNIDELWRNLKAGRDAVTEIPKERWDWRDYFNSEPEQCGSLGKSYCKWGGFIDGYDSFDPFFFNISPREAGYMDLQERLFLEVAWETLEDAGYTRNYFERRKAEQRTLKVGVYVGATWQEGQLYTDTNKENDGAIFSTHAYAIANRVSFFCNFEGPSLTVDTACSSSLTAIHLAWESIVNGSVDMALAGGVNLSIHPNKFLVLAGAGFASKKGRCQSFGSEGDGYVPGEGVGALLLKPKAKAIADGDHIYGIIKGSAINHGGKTNGYTIPSPTAQAEVVRDALRKAKVDPRTVSYIEAHGTGTALGDPIEVAGLAKAFGEQPRSGQFCALGSIKANIGHCEAAAGISGITKVLLQLSHRQLAPTIHAEDLNPKIDFANSPFRVQRELADWNRPLVNCNGQVKEFPRIAGVSSFGAGGANAHLVIEEYISKVPIESDSKRPGIFLIVLSAKNRACLQSAIQRLFDYVTNNEDRTVNHLANLAYTLQVGRDAMDERIAFVVESIDELQSRLNLICGETKEAPGIFHGRISRGEDAPPPQELKSKNGLILAKSEAGALLEHWVRGGQINWEQMHQDEVLCRVRLPTYPFSRERYPLPAVMRMNSETAEVLMPQKVETSTAVEWDGLTYIPQWREKTGGRAKKRAGHNSANVFLVYGRSSMALVEAIQARYKQQFPSANLISLEIGNDLEAHDGESFERLLANHKSIERV